MFSSFSFILRLRSRPTKNFGQTKVNWPCAIDIDAYWGLHEEGRKAGYLWVQFSTLSPRCGREPANIGGRRSRTHRGWLGVSSVSCIFTPGQSPCCCTPELKSPREKIMAQRGALSEPNFLSAPENSGILRNPDRPVFDSRIAELFLRGEWRSDLLRMVEAIDNAELGAADLVCRR